jgi:ubiquinone/menaquinone biosynthesis C-methylase UbiE
VGVGAGSDSIRFARAGAHFTGVDLTEAAIALTSRRFGLEGYDGNFETADAENLTFPNDSFDFVYSWGVIHHTPDVPAAARQLVRVLRPGGRLCVMIYHRHSLVALQCWILNALLRGRPTRSLREVIAENIESDGTQAFTRSEAADLFNDLEDVHVTPVVTPYDVRYTRSRFFPRWVQQLIPRRFGWFLVVEGRKP